MKTKNNNSCLNLDSEKITSNENLQKFAELMAVLIEKYGAEVLRKIETDKMRTKE